MSQTSIKGFTLVELMVVIAIIGIMSTIVLSNLQRARVEANDARRKHELRTLSTLLSVYRDTNGGNPINRGGATGYPDTSINFLQELVTSGYLANNPKAPSNDATNPYYYYDYGPGSPGMILFTQLEGAAPTINGAPGTCRPFASGTNFCDQSSNNYFCLCVPY